MLPTKSLLRTALFTLALTATTSSPAGDLSDKDFAVLEKDIKAMSQAFADGNLEVFLTKTHPAIYKITGGKENFETILKEGVKQLRETGIKILSDEVQKPDRTYLSGKDEVCFVPKTSIMKMGEQKVKSKGFMLAVRSADGPWLYLDGSGLAKNPDLLWTLFPDLPKDLKMPDSSMELIEE